MTTRGYRWVVLLVLVGALAVTALARAPRRAPARPAPEPARPVVELEFTVRDHALEPSVAEVPLGHRVRLAIVQRGAADVSLTLAGYEDRVHVERLAPGATWRGEFVADRPGEGFAWLLDGEPAGRLAVLGSHLEEGHR
jgi:hypothetical protein